MKSLKLLVATGVAIALSASVTASTARDRSSTSKNQIQSPSNQWLEMSRDQKTKGAEDTTSRGNKWRDEMTRDQTDDSSPAWRGSAARERMRDQGNSSTGIDRQTTTGRSGTGMRDLDQLGSARVIFYRLGPADMRMSKLVGSDIRNLQNENVGEIEDIIFDKSKNMRAVIVSIGGFLGMGERYVAVDPSSIVITRNEDGDVEAVLNTTREDLREAPQFNFDERRGRVGRAN
jgi:sporulation protein YlmC with PRC-barrel domain